MNHHALRREVVRENHRRVLLAPIFVVIFAGLGAIAVDSYVTISTSAPQLESANSNHPHSLEWYDERHGFVFKVDAETNQLLFSPESASLGAKWTWDPPRRAISERAETYDLCLGVNYSVHCYGGDGEPFGHIGFNLVGEPVGEPW